MVRHGKARRGSTWRGKAWVPMEHQRISAAGHGEVGCGLAWPGLAGMAGHGPQRGISFTGAFMIPSRDDITEAVDSVYKLTRDLNRGDVLTHQAIRSVLNVEPHTGSWGHVMRKVRKRLQDERGIATWPETTVGYRLCTASEQLELPERRLRRAARQARRGRMSVEALPDRSLTLHQRRIKQFMTDRARESELRIKREARAMSAETKPTPVLPRRPIGA